MSELPPPDDYRSDFEAPSYTIIDRWHENGIQVTRVLLEGVVEEFRVPIETVEAVQKLSSSDKREFIEEMNAKFMQD